MIKCVGRYAVQMAALVTFLWLSAMLGATAFADDNRKLPKIGELWFPDPNIVAPWRDAFRQGLSELGYVDGRNVTIVTRYARGDASRFPTLLAELIAQNVDVMIVSPKAVQEAKRATKTIPIVVAGLVDPVAEGIAISLARPGGNFTGTSWASPDASGKRLQLAMELLPKLRRVALLFDVNAKGALVEVQGTRAAAASIKFAIRELRD